jgi:hypothetical protein
MNIQLQFSGWIMYRMSEKHEHEDDVDIYGDLPNFPCVEDTVKKVNILQDVQNFSCPCYAVFCNN